MMPRTKKGKKKFPLPSPRNEQEKACEYENEDTIEN